LGGIENPVKKQGDLEEGEVDDADGHENKEASEALPATQLEIAKHRFRLRGIRRRQLAGPHANAKIVVLTHTAFTLGTFIGVINPAWIAKNWSGLLVAANVYGSFPAI